MGLKTRGKLTTSLHADGEVKSRWDMDNNMLMGKSKADGIWITTC